MSRPIIYWTVGAGLVVCSSAVQGSPWLAGPGLHTILEVVATLTALMVGAMAMVRYYDKPNMMHLIIVWRC